MKNELMHYGVKGMKWGVRRTKKAIKKYTKKADKQIKGNSDRSRSLKNILKNDKLDNNDRQAYEKGYDMTVKTGQMWLNAKKDLLSMDASKIDAKEVKKYFDEVKKKSPWYFE